MPTEFTEMKQIVVFKEYFECIHVAQMAPE